MTSPADDKRHAPAAARNREPLWEVLARVCLDVDAPLDPHAGPVLEVAAGTGEHAVFFADKLRALCGDALVYQPTDLDPDARRSIDAWRAEAGLANLLPALPLDAASDPWPALSPDNAACAVLAVNMVHISPWAATLGLVRGAARVLRPGAPLILYGPYRQHDVVTAESNEAFDQSLRARDPAWGLRHLDDVAAAAAAAGFGPPAVTSMPANNLTVVFRRR